MEQSPSYIEKTPSLEEITRMIARVYEKRKTENTKNNKKIFMEIVKGLYEEYFREKSGLTFKAFLSKVRKKMVQLEEEEKIKKELELEDLEKEEERRIQTLEDQSN